MGISIGMLGLGSFASCFVDLFKSHPLVDRIAFCDREVDRVKRWADDPFLAKKFNPKDCYYSLEELCESDVDAIVIMTQPWLHAPQAVQAMNAGKDVYSAVPIISIPDDDEILDWCGKIIETSLKTGKHYMLGETTCYRPNAICLRKSRKMRLATLYQRRILPCAMACNLRRVSQSRQIKGGTGSESSSGKYYDRDLRAPDELSDPFHLSNAIMDTASRSHATDTKQNQRPVLQNLGFSNEIALFKINNGATVESRKHVSRRKTVSR